LVLKLLSSRLVDVGEKRKLIYKRVRELLLRYNDLLNACSLLFQVYTVRVCLNCFLIYKLFLKIQVLINDSPDFVDGADHVIVDVTD
jgi:hypothetical protein